MIKSLEERLARIISPEDWRLVDLWREEIRKNKHAANHERAIENQTRDSLTKVRAIMAILGNKGGCNGR